MLRDLPSPLGSFDRDEIFMNAPGMAQDDIRPQTPVDPLDDVFGSGPSSPNLIGTDAGNANNHATRLSATDPSDIPRLRTTHVTNGYREGIAASKEQHLQNGFDQGYATGAELGLKAGWCLGALEGIVRAVPEAGFTISSPSQLLVSKMPDAALPSTKSPLRNLLRLAKDELDIGKLFGPEYFNSDGLPIYEVPSQTENDEADNREGLMTGIAHPVLSQWNDVVHELAMALGLRVP